MSQGKATWKPIDDHDAREAPQSREDLPDSAFAFPRQRKEPLTDGTHVVNAIARFNQVEDVSDEDKDLAFANIKKAASHYGVTVQEDSWRELSDQ